MKQIISVGGPQWLIAAVATAMLAGCSLAPTSSNSGQDAVASWNALGEQHLADGDALAAGRAFREARSIAPANSRAGAGLARSYHLLGELESAERLFQEVTRDTNAVAARHYFARFYLVQGRYNRAERLLSSVLQPVDYEGRTSALIDRGLLALVRGDRRDAEYCWHRALAREPGQREALWHLAHLARLQGAKDRSVDYVTTYARYHEASVTALRQSLNQLPMSGGNSAGDTREGSSEPRCA